MIKKLDGDSCHDLLLRENKPKLSFDERADFDVWRKEVREKLFELLRLERIKENACPLKVDFEERAEFDTYTRIRFTFESERGCTVPAYLLIPKGKGEKYPLAITLQGHSTGFHNSVGIIKYDMDKEYQERGKFAIQAVENGFAALCIEQRGMGEVRSRRYPGPGGVHACSFTALTALNLGRNLIGERVWDISRAIDVMEELDIPEIDLRKIMITGNSGGGTASYYAACCDERISYAAPSCSFCSYKTSVMDILHCVCNNVPDICLWLEMQDLACLIAPRALTVITGELDDIFPIEGVSESYKTLERIYSKANASERLRLVQTPKAHYWCKDIVWQTIKEDTQKLGW